MVDAVKAFQDALKKEIHKQVAGLMEFERIDGYDESYDEEKQEWQFIVDFNEGSLRRLEILLNIQPDGE